MRPIKYSLTLASLTGLLAFGSCALVSRSAEASPTYPPFLENAVAEQIPNAPKCAPQCTACHLTTAGGFGTLNKFGHNLQMIGGLLPGGSQADVTHALKILVAADPDSDGDGIKDVEEIEAGDSPALAAPNGAAQWCPDIKYGCGARIAAAPPAVDGPGLFSAGLVVLGFAVARRWRGSARAHRLPS